MPWWLPCWAFVKALCQIILVVQSSYDFVNFVNNVLVWFKYAGCVWHVSLNYALL